MYGFSTLDLVAFAWFVLAWAGYGVAVELTPIGRNTLNHRMDRHRDDWTKTMLGRDLRIIDTQIMASLQNGTAFFASTSLLAVGGAFALLRASEEVLALFTQLPFGIRMTQAVWETKVFGILLIFVYAFFKFAWSYRLFNYAAILIGADCPELRARDLRRAAQLLRGGCDAVLAPAEDGGYALIGLRRVSPRLFAGLEWGGPQVYSRTALELAKLGWRWRALRTVWDVDRPQDLERLRASRLLERR